MAWNEPGNKGNGDRDPWGNKNKNQGPPDLDAVLGKLGRRFTALFGKKASGGHGRSPISGTAFAIVIGLIVIVWVISGFYTIKEAQRGVLLRFGSYQGMVAPGLRWKPTFVDKVIPVDVESIRSLPASGFMLTEDENVVRVELDVQYRVTEPEKYLFSVTNADDSLRQATDSALRYVIGHTSMDDILTVGREKVRQDTWQLIEKIIQPYDMGLSVVDVNFLPARPPEEVKEAFDDAIAAQEDEQTFIRQAEAYKREVEPKARGQVQRLLQQAEAYKQQAVLKAQGEVAQFDKLLPEYRQAPEVTRQRLYMETMESIYGKTSKVFLDSKNNGNLLYLPIDKLMEMQKNKSNADDSGQMVPSVNPSSDKPAPSSSNNSAPLRSSDSRSDRYGRG
ncbi:FtsH protease activity modulator HflK [Celerinatantimonas sp. YJH-8]|uniref:FtsH protease activity modulator HflK n=1 Tax=Celerinatantimonas sp. YJH-8 TaxID=3228714 RepID=UPI0038C51021